MKIVNLIVAYVLFSSILYAQTVSKEAQISAAVQTAPEEQQSGAKVMGYDSDNKLIVLREGTNNLICLADNPNQAGYNAACYHKDLEAFMSRGRVLKAEGKGRKEIFDIREKEAKAGSLKMPERPTTLHIRYGKEGKYNSETGKVENTHLRYVVYIPWATPESTGLPLKPIVPGGPWIMDPGSHRAHIMITPPKSE